MADEIWGTIIEWGLILLFVAMFLFVFYSPAEGFMGKIAKLALGAEKYLPVETKKEVKQDEALPLSLINAQKKFIEEISSFPQTEKCLLKFTSLNDLGDYKMKLSNYEGKIISKIEKPLGKEGAIELNPVETKDNQFEICVTNPEEFYDCYISSQKRDCTKPIYNTLNSVEISKDSVIIGERSYSLDETILFKPGKGKVCFINTLGKSFLGMNIQSKSFLKCAIDGSCLKLIKNEIPECEKENKWLKVLQDYEKNKCMVDKYTCRAENLPCQCFNAGLYQTKEKPRICDISAPYCYDKLYGCNSKGPDYGNNLEICQKTNKDFELAQKCEVSDVTCGIKNPPCSCTNLAGQTFVCMEGQYCYYGQVGCSKEGPDKILYFDYCQKSNPNFELAKIEECTVDSKCKAINIPCKCSLAGGQYEICLEKGDNYCHKNNVGCSQQAC